MAAVATARRCLRCDLDLGPEVWNTPAPIPCPRCQTPLIARVFPASQRTLAPGSAGEALIGDDLASCFFHPAKKATVACADCGRFVCALCDLEIDGRNLCPSCLEAGRKKDTITALKTRVTRWDQIALMLAVIPLISIYFTVFTAPAALFISLWKWKSTSQYPVHRGKARFVIAILLSLVQIGLWVALVSGFLSGRFGRFR